MSTEPPDTRRALVLDGTSRASELLGGKGAALDQLIQWAIPVPPAGAATTEAYREVARSPAVDELTSRIRSGETVAAADVDAIFERAVFAEDLAAEILTVARDVGRDRPLAVRSSATVEDLAGSSFAGQYRSLLDVDPFDDEQLLEAVSLVFASLWHPAPCAYRAAFGIDDSGVAMAAVVMQMVTSRRAGVVFTVDPGGEPDAARVEAVEGLGESLVSGQRTPEAWVLPREGDEFEGPVEVARALELAMTIEQYDGKPQDVEWAYDGSTLWIVQSRPITVSPLEHGDGFDSPIDVAQLTTAGIGEMLPGVLPPLRWQLASHLVDEAFLRVVADLGAASRSSSSRRPFVRRVRGRAAMDFDALRDLARRLPGGSAEELEMQYFGSRTPGRAAAPSHHDVGRLATLRHDLRTLVLQKRAALDAEIVIHAVHALDEALDTSSLESDALFAYQLRLVDLAVRGTAAELAVAASAASSYRKIELLLMRHLGQAEAGRWAERVTSGRGIAPAMSPNASAAVFAGPTWTELEREPPSSELLRDRQGTEPASVQNELFNALRDTRSWGATGLRSALRTRALRHLIEETVTLLRRREETKDALFRLGGEVRRTVLEMGRRLVELEIIDEPSEAELLTIEELHACLGGEPVAPNTIAMRRRWRQRYEDEPPLPMVFVGLPEQEPAEIPEGDRLDGWAASPGRFTGRAVVVTDPDADFETGTVLVAVTTDASWSPLFVRAGAIVVERGGPLSHAAILARELGVPAVLNVQGATQTFGGQEITVDGDTGIVVVHSTPASDRTHDNTHNASEQGS